MNEIYILFFRIFLKYVGIMNKSKQKYKKSKM